MNTEYKIVKRTPGGMNSATPIQYMIKWRFKLWFIPIMPYTWLGEENFEMFSPLSFNTKQQAADYINKCTTPDKFTDV